MAAVIAEVGLSPHASERRLITGAGTEERRWGAARLDALPLCAIDDWNTRYRCIWIVSPHPDDEILALGGSIAMLADRDADVRIVSVTDGEASHEGSPRWTPERLAATRAAELQDGLHTLGARPVITRAGLRDGRVTTQRQPLLRMLVDQVLAEDLILVTCRFDGHPDHEASGEVAMLAAELTGAAVLEYPVWMWHWATPEETTIPWARARRIALDDATVAKKDAAIHRFTSQIERDGDREAILPPHVLERFARDFEVVFEP